MSFLSRIMLLKSQAHFATGGDRAVVGKTVAIKGTGKRKSELARKRVGLIVEGAPAREGAEILDASGAAIGVVTSGGFAPSLGKAIALGFVPPEHAVIGKKLQVSVRGRAQPAEIVPTPFVPHRYFRKSA